ncbi:hypothetical protein [Pedobacter sp. Leaf194]|uniref:hypothetical protein n=1 Tax=Pedobacter sp. Leaf194 TaxID=1736297 RepID=UPI000A6C1A41|nr:hypothetical protein [Pedobacter sp. Leaf194]
MFVNCATVLIDIVNIRGERKVLYENFNVLRDFNSNESAPLNNTLFVVAVASIDRLTWLVKVVIPEISPDVQLNKPKGATHYKITAGAALVILDHAVGIEIIVTSESDAFPNNSATPGFTLNNTLAPNALAPILLVFGVSFYQEVNSGYYSLNN